MIQIHIILFISEMQGVNKHSIIFQIMFQEYFNSQKSKINENNFLLLEMNIEIFIILFMIEKKL